MRIAGTLTGLTPKDKADGTVIELKITIPFDSQDLGDLGAMFGTPVIADVRSQQGELALDDAGASNEMMERR